MEPNENPFAPPAAASDVDPTAPLPTDDDVVRRAHLAHEGALRTVGLLWICGGAGFAVVSLGMDLTQRLGFRMLYSFAAAVVLAVGILTRRLHPYVRFPGAAVAALGLLGGPVGGVVSLYLLYLFLSPQGGVVLSRPYAAVRARTPYLRPRAPVWLWGVVAAVALAVGIALFAGLS